MGLKHLQKPQLMASRQVSLQTSTRKANRARGHLLSSVGTTRRSNAQQVSCQSPTLTRGHQDGFGSDLRQLTAWPAPPNTILKACAPDHEPGWDAGVHWVADILHPLLSSASQGLHREGLNAEQNRGSPRTKCPGQALGGLWTLSKEGSPIRLLVRACNPLVMPRVVHKVGDGLKILAVSPFLMNHSPRQTSQAQAPSKPSMDIN